MRASDRPWSYNGLISRTSALVIPSRNLGFATSASVPLSGALKAHLAGSPPARRGSAATDKDQIKAMRSWAKDKGLKVSDRGRVSADVQEAYNKAH